MNFILCRNTLFTHTNILKSFSMRSLRILRFFSITVLFLSLLGFSPERSFAQDSSKAPNKIITYLALGDSYTIGESVSEKFRWPVQLVDSLSKNNLSIKKLDIVAKTGWTTAELQKGIEKRTLLPNYDFVSLLIGVNNQYRGYNIEIYKKEFRELLLQAVEFAGGESSKVFVVSIPNYGVTPFGLKNEEKIRKELLEYDAIATSIASEYDIPFVNITPISEKAKKDTSLIAVDKLHPSGKMYSAWVHTMLPTVLNLLEQ